MNTTLDCIPCFLRQGLEAARSVSEDARLHEQIVREMLRLTADLDFARPPPSLAQVLHRRLRELTGVADAYQPAKTRFNRLAMEALPDLGVMVRGAGSAPRRGKVRCRRQRNRHGDLLNIADDEVRTALRGSPAEVVHPRWEQFRQTVARAKDILYLADNAGEIAVDRLAIQELGPERVTVAVRGGPVLNDATVTDAREVRMYDLAEVIDNGSDAPGTILGDCSESFRRRFERAHLIIAKGQGNFETLCSTGKNIAFWFKVKCPFVSRLVGLPLGSHVLLPPEAV